MRRRLLLETLEDRFLPSGYGPAAAPAFSPHLNFREFHDPSRIPAGLTPSALGILPQVNGVPFPVGFTPDQIQAAYGINNIKFGTVTGDGTGQTIAIVDAYDDPKFVNSTASGFASSDLAQFDAQLGIPNPPSFTKVNQSGQASPLPPTDPSGAGNISGNWEIEEALDIEWAHAIAPGASIILVEAGAATDAALFAAVATAAGLPGVSAVSMSWGDNEFSGEAAQDSTFVTPAGHQGVTFVAASGDSGGFAPDAQGQPTATPGVLYPAASPNVLAVGGTSLQLNADDTYNSETAWSGGGGGTSLYETQPAFQQGIQQTGKRTIPDISFVADPNTGVAIYDTYNNTDGSGPWVEIGGTSLAAPAWAGLIAIANQGRVLAGASTLDGPAQTLTAIYAFSSADFNDVTSGSNGVFKAGTGYDETTGLGTPKAAAVIADLSTYATASKIAVIAQPPASVIVGDSFGVVIAAENARGGVDPAFSGTLTLALDANHPGAKLGGTLTAIAAHGVAVFDGLTIDQLGTGYTLQISGSKFPAITTNAFDVIADPTPWQGTFYPVPTDASLRTAISEADSNGHSFNTIILSASRYLLSDKSAGGLMIGNASSLPAKTLTITGQGQTNSVIGSVFNWHDRILQINGSPGHALSVTLQNLAIQGGHAFNGGVLGGTTGLGGGLLITDAAVTLANVLVQNNEAHGDFGATGAAGVAPGSKGTQGGAAQNANGGGIYLASGTLSLWGDTFLGNDAQGGKGGHGGEGGNQGTKNAPGVTGGVGGAGGKGGSAAGGGIYVAGGTVLLNNDSFRSNQAVGGPGGDGGTGGSGGHGSKPGGVGGAGGVAAPGSGGAIFLAAGSLTLSKTTLQNNSAMGGSGGQGGLGGAGTLVAGSITAIFGGNGSTFGGTGARGAGGKGGNGGAAGAAAAGGGGGVYVAQGSLTLLNLTLTGNQAIGGQGGVGGRGGTGGFAAAGTSLGFPVGKTGGHGGLGAAGGSGYGGGIQVAGGKVVLSANALNANIAKGGQGGAGGLGGYGPLSALGSGSLGLGTGTGGSLGGGTSGGGGGANSAGPGGNGGNGGNGYGGGVYVAVGALTLSDDTVAANTADVGAKGSGGLGGKAGTGNLTGGPGVAGNPGSSFAGGLYVASGSVNLDNSTVALNTQAGTGSGGGLVAEPQGTVTAVSAIFAGNGTVDFSGSVTATNSLFQTAPINGQISGQGNQVKVDPLLDPKGLQSNGGPSQTIALQANSPALGAGANPESLFTDQRGYAGAPAPAARRSAPVETDAQADTQAPTATLQASAVTDANAASLVPYTFSITYTDNVAIAWATLSNVDMEILPPGLTAPIRAVAVNTTAVGATDSLGDAVSFVVTYQITPPTPSWTPADNGTYTVSLGGGGVTDLAGNTVASGTLGTFTVTVQPGSFSKFTISVVGGNSVMAGAPTLIIVQATDQFGDPVTGYNGPITFTTSDPQVPTLPPMTMSNGFGAGLVTLKTVAGGPWTITATAGAFTGISSPITVTPGSAVYFHVAAPATAITGNSLAVTVTALDSSGNVATNYAGTVKLSSTDSAAVLAGDLGGSYTFTTGAGGDDGVHVFNVKLLTAGSQKITAGDTTATAPAILGTGAAIAAAGLAVTDFRQTPTGFIATFNQPINPGNLTFYGTGSTQQDIMLIGKKTNNGQPYPGTLIIDATKTLITFNVSSNFLVASNPGGSATLPDDVYTVTLTRGIGNNGFQDLTGQGFDDGHGGHADYIGNFTTTYQHDNTPVLGIVDFARGPNASGDTTTLVKVPNDPANGGHVGIPITMYNASSLTSAGFTLTYNSNILTVTGGISDPSNAAATFHMTSNVMDADGVHSIATFAFTSAAPQNGTLILGDITAYVPYSARSQYQVKDLLALSNIAVSGGATVVPADAVDVDAYFGDVNGDHHLDGLDKGLIANVASTVSTGFTAFTLLDPAIVGDVSDDNAVTSNDTSLFSNYLLALPVAKIPPLPNPPIADNLFASPFAADPALSLPATVQASAGGVVNVPVLLDDAHPAGSTGLVEAELTLRYDPAVLSVSAADIALGTLPSQGTGWQLAAQVDASTGQITIQLYSQTPLTSDQAGSLVNIAFHLKSGQSEVDHTTVGLVESQTVLADQQGAMILSLESNWTAVLKTGGVR